MKLKLLAAALFALAILQSCRYGTTVESFPPARSPRGVTGIITTNGGDIKAELIEVRVDSLLILADSRLRILPYTAITSSRFSGLSGRYNVGIRRAPSPEVRERLRLVSRFPQGLTPDMLRRLMDANAQTQLDGEAP